MQVFIYYKQVCTLATIHLGFDLLAPEFYNLNFGTARM
jgi:hypothetical protein